MKLLILEDEQVSDKAFEAEEVVSVGPDLDLVGDISVLFLHNFIQLQTELEAQLVELSLRQLSSKTPHQLVTVHSDGRHYHTLIKSLKITQIIRLWNLWWNVTKLKTKKPEMTPTYSDLSKQNCDVFFRHAVFIPRLLNEYINLKKTLISSLIRLCFFLHEAFNNNNCMFLIKILYMLYAYLTSYHIYHQAYL